MQGLLCGVENINTNKYLHYIVKYGANYFLKSYYSLECLLCPDTTPYMYCTTFWLNFKRKGLCERPFVALTVRNALKFFLPLFLKKKVNKEGCCNAFIFILKIKITLGPKAIICGKIMEVSS